VTIPAIIDRLEAIVGELESPPIIIGDRGAASAARVEPAV